MRLFTNLDIREITDEISIHAPLTGCDGYLVTVLVLLVLFQSTHPLRDATVGSHTDSDKAIISIHAPLTGCDNDCCYISTNHD